MKWEVTGAWKADGVEASMIVEAPNQRAAESIASDRGMMVEQAIPQPAQAVAVPPALPANNYRLVKNIFGIAALGFTVLSVLDGDTLLYYLATFAAIVWFAMAVAQQKQDEHQKKAIS